MFSIEEIKKFIIKYQPSGIIVDTNILLLFLIGSYDINFIKDCKLLNNSNKKYNDSDFELLKKIISCFKKVIITPHILAEISNLSIKQGLFGPKLLSYIKTVILFLKKAEERHQKSDCIWGMELEILGKYGFTDMTMFELAKQTNMPILTDEHPLYGYSYGRVPIIKFEHIKNQPLQSVFK